MSWFKASPKHRTDVSRSDGWRIWIDGAMLRATAPGREQAPIQLAQTWAIRLCTTFFAQGGQATRIEFHGVGCVSVPLDCDGLDEVIAFFRSWPGFDPSPLRRPVTEPGRQFVNLWRRKPVPNASVVEGMTPEQALEELRRGPVLLACPSAGREADLPISWDITYDELGAIPGVEIVQSLFHHSSMQFGPIRIFGLTIDQMRTPNPGYAQGSTGRRDVPVAQWQMGIVLRDDMIGNYQAVKRHLSGVLGAPDMSQRFHNREDPRGNALHWDIAGIGVQLFYSLDTYNRPEDGECVFFINNKREYPQFLTDAYCQNLASVTGAGQKCLSWRFGECWSGALFRSSRWIRKPPEVVLKALGQDSLIVWSDIPAGRVGFSTSEHAVVIPLQEAKALTFRNTLPGRGPGSSALHLLSHDGAATLVIGTRPGELDAAAEAIAALTGLALIRLPDEQDI